MLVNFIIVNYASAFFFAGAFFALGAAASFASAVFGLVEAVRFNFALIASLLLETPKEPIVLFPFAVFLSPLPITIKLNYGAIIVKSDFITNFF